MATHDQAAEQKPYRSALYLPASNAKAIAKARTLACDVVILDLEDAVAPEEKALAREQAVAAVRDGGFGARELVVRVNALDTEWGLADLASLRKVGVPTLLAPKVNSPRDVNRYADLIGDHTNLWVMIETASSIFQLDKIAGCAGSTNLTGFVMGTNDLAKEMGATLTVKRLPFVGMLGLAVAAARAHGLIILDGVFNDIQDHAGFAEQASQAVEFGFDGKTVIHPTQIEPANAAFTPSDSAMAEAQNIVAAFALPENVGKGAIRVDGRMVERLHLQQALSVIAKRNVCT